MVNVCSYSMRNVSQCSGIGIEANVEQDQGHVLVNLFNGNEYPACAQVVMFGSL